MTEKEHILNGMSDYLKATHRLLAVQDIEQALENAFRAGEYAALYDTPIRTSDTTTQLKAEARSLLGLPPTVP